jgi:hypothetical protein
MKKKTLVAVEDSENSPSVAELASNMGAGIAVYLLHVVTKVKISDGLERYSDS